MTDSQIYDGITESLRYFVNIDGIHNTIAFIPARLSEYVVYKIKPFDDVNMPIDYINNTGEIVREDPNNHFILLIRIKKKIRGINNYIYLYASDSHNKITRAQRDMERSRQHFSDAPGGPSTGHHSHAAPGGPRGGRRSNKKMTKRNHKKNRKSNKRR